MKALLGFVIVFSSPWTLFSGLVALFAKEGAQPKNTGLGNQRGVLVGDCKSIHFILPGLRILT